MLEDRRANNLPLRKTIFYVVQRGINEDACIVPCTRFDADSFVNKTMRREVAVGNGDC